LHSAVDEHLDLLDNFWREVGKRLLFSVAPLAAPRSCD
jgi:hypothetical protein